MIIIIVTIYLNYYILLSFFRGGHNGSGAGAGDMKGPKTCKVAKTFLAKSPSSANSASKRLCSRCATNTTAVSGACDVASILVLVPGWGLNGYGWNMQP